MYCNECGQWKDTNTKCACGYRTPTEGEQILIASTVLFYAYIILRQSLKETDFLHRLLWGQK